VIKIKMDKEKILKAGKIASEVREWIRKKIKKDMLLVEIADMIEDKMVELGGKPAFPTCLSVDENAAHYIPYHNDTSIAKGILKVDMGVHIDGWIADTAFSLDLDNNEENKKIIQASEKALENAIKEIKVGIKVRDIGKKVHETINSYDLNPIMNLFGHSIEQWDLHAGISIPNVDNGDNRLIKPGLYAIEPFSTNGNGKVRDGKKSATYLLQDDKNVRNQNAREILKFIVEEYKTIPFCSRWIVKKFGPGSLISLKQLEENGNIHNYSVLVESSDGKVSQSEHTILVENDKITVTTK